MTVTRHRVDILVAVVLFILINTLLARFQQPVSYHNGLGWDGVHYAKVTQDFRDGNTPAAEQPFVNRIAVPYLASLFESDIVTSWRLLGLTANALSLILLYVLLCLHFRQQWLRFLLLALFIIPNFSVVRRLWYDPVSTDQWDKVFLFAGFIILDRLKTKGWRPVLAVSLSAVALIGVLFREIVIILPLAALLVTNPVDFDPSRLRIRNVSLPPIISAMPFLGAMAGFCIVKSIVTPADGDYSIYLQSLHLLYNKSLPDYMLGWFIAFGPLLIFPLYEWRTSAKFLACNQHIFVYLTAFALLGWIGGTATYRLVQWTMPAVFILIGHSLEFCAPAVKRNWLFITALVASFLLSQRVFWLWPDYPGGISTYYVFLTPLSANPPVLDTIGMGSLYVRVVSLASHLVISAVLLLLLNPPTITIKKKIVTKQGI